MWLRNGLSLQTFIYNSILLTDLECYGEGFSLSADWFLIDFSDIPNCIQKFALIREQVMDINEMVAVTLDLLIGLTVTAILGLIHIDRNSISPKRHAVCFNTSD